MENICPLCNGLYTKTEYCPNCGHPLVDQGMAEEFLEPYSPYQERDLYMWQQDIEHPELGEEYCVHLFSCPRCAYDCRVPVHLITH